MKRIIIFTISHCSAIVLGFALGIYMLPILIAPEPPSLEKVKSMAEMAEFKASFRKDLKGSDFLHWGRGEVFLSSKRIVFRGELAPGPDYKIYLTDQYVETEKDFIKIKASALRIGEVKTFNNFIVTINKNVDLKQYTSIVIWCETFSQFITAAKYR